MVKRIAMLSVHTCPLATLGGKETGGMNVYVRDLSRELSRRGVYVDVYTRSQDPAIPRVSTSLAERGRVIHIKAGPEKPYNKNRVYNHLDEFVAGVRAQTNADDVTYDIVYSHYWLSGIAAKHLREQWDIPFLQMFHTLAEMKNRVAQSDAEREPVHRSNCEGELMTWADRLVAATPLEKNQMSWLYGASPEKISVVPPGVDLERFRPLDKKEARLEIGIPAHHKLILFVGRIQPLKGIDVLMKALARIKRQDPHLLDDVCVSLIGGAPQPDAEIEQAEFDRLETLRSELGIGDLITFLGAKDQDKLVYYYAAAEMVVMPSHYESFGMVALEAMACATPIIASDVGGLSFSIEDGFNGYLVPGRNPEALADKIRMLLKYPVLRDQFGEQARTWVARYSWVDVAAEILDVFDDTLSHYQKRQFKEARSICGQCLP